MSVFPCRPRDKRPATEHGCKDATRDPEIIKAWWGPRPDYNIGIATGIASGVFVIDVDGDGESELQKLEADYGALPSSVEAITARGRHYYLKAPKAPIGNSAGVLAPHVDIRGDGGYVLAPPSIHPSGKRYCWSVDSANAFATPNSFRRKDRDRVAVFVVGCDGQAKWPTATLEQIVKCLDYSGEA